MSNLILVDTSAWLRVLPPRGGPSTLAERVRALLSADQVATTGLIRLELLSGARSQVDLQSLSGMLAALHQLPVPEERWDEAARLGFLLRRHGLRVPFADILIAAVAIAAGASVLHVDRHFDLIAAHAPLLVERG
jgi:predicted nucleic acid-binding protein